MFFIYFLDVAFVCIIGFGVSTATVSKVTSLV